MGLKGTLDLNAIVGFDLNESSVVAMVARVPIIRTYDPSTESMLA